MWKMWRLVAWTEMDNNLEMKFTLAGTVSRIFSFQESQILPLSGAESYREKYFSITAASIIIIFICDYQISASNLFITWSVKISSVIIKNLYSITTSRYLLWIILINGFFTTTFSFCSGMLRYLKLFYKDWKSRGYKIFLFSFIQSRSQPRWK